MRKLVHFSALLSLFLLVPASITCAQTISSQKGLTTAVFNLQQGIIKVYLPGDIRPGDIISGRIVAEPVGKNAKQTRINLAELNNYSISIYNSKIPIDNVNKPFRILIPPDKTKHFLVGLINAAGTVKTEITVPSIPEKATQTTSSGCNIPSHALTGSPLRITGPFDGDASNTKCMLDNKPMEILAESPGACIVYFPSTTGGMHSLSNQENSKPACTKMISGVDMTVSAGKLNLLKGEKTYIDVQVTGLRNLLDTARLTLINKTPDVITLANGNTITVSIPPKPDSSMSTYSQRFTVQSIKTGSFTAIADIDLPEMQPTTVSYSTPNTSPATTQASILIFGGDININKNGQHIFTNEKELYKVYAFDNSVFIFLKDSFVTEYVVTNPGTVSVQDKLAEYADDTYPAPAIDCDSLTRICRKNAALNVFWGDVYSAFEGKSETSTIKGEPFSKNLNSSLLVTRGWEINCCTGEFQLKLFFGAMQEGNDRKETHLSFSKILRNGDPCIPIICPECKSTCEESIRLLEEGRKQMEETMKKNPGKN